MADNPPTPSAAERASSMPASLLHPKNLGLLAIEHADLPQDQPIRVAVVQTADWRAPEVYLEVSLPDGPACELEITDADDVESLAGRIRRADETIRDAARMLTVAGSSERTIGCPACGRTWHGGSTVLDDQERP